jgi:alpha-L-fucosidase 2
MGVLLWGQGQIVKLSLDRGDLWDNRTSEIIGGPKWNWQTVKKCVQERNATELSNIFDKAYAEPFPTKLPGGRIELDLPESATINSFELDLRRALGTVFLSKGTIEVFCSAVDPVIMVRLLDLKADLRIVPPAFGVKVDDKERIGISKGSLGRLGYPAPKHETIENVQIAIQQCESRWPQTTSDRGYPRTGLGCGGARGPYSRPGWGKVGP